MQMQRAEQRPADASTCVQLEHRWQQLLLHFAFWHHAQ
jgi:hypothetical protein